MDARGTAGRLLVGLTITSLLAACASSGAPTWTFAPVPPRTMEPEPMAAAAPESVVATCQPGSTPNKPGPVDQARPLGLSGMAGLSRMAFDRRAGRLVALAGTLDGPVETWTFDVCTNTWTRMNPNQPPTPGSRGLVYDVHSDLTIASDSAGMWAYDLEANTWTERGLMAPPALAHPALANLRFYHPGSGRIVDLGDDGDDDTLGLALWTYEVETDTWTPIQAESLAIGPHYEFFAYDASIDRLVAYANAWGPPDADGNRLFGARAWLLDFRTGSWSRTGTAAPGFSAGWWGHVPAMAYDEAAERTVILGQGHSAAYDATADHWETLYETPSRDQLPCTTRPECRQLQFMVYDPVNERLVVFGGFVLAAGSEVYPDDVLAFNTRTREWTVLLEASERLRGPSSE